MLFSRLSPAGEPPIFAAGLRRADTALPTPSDTACSLEDLAAGSEAVLVFDAAVADGIRDSLGALWEEMPAGESAFIALVPRRPSPRVDPDYGQPTPSFLCSADLFARFLRLGIDCWPKTLCFAVLRAIADGDVAADRLLVKQLPSIPPLRRHPKPPHAVILPHRGKESHLRAALDSSQVGRKWRDRARRPRREEPSAYSAWSTEYPNVEFFHFDPAPVGPYVIRQELAERSPEPLLALQDSDDLSCHDRFTVLSDALLEWGCGIVGSHELCLDEMRCLVQPVRYPLDCSAALRISPNHALLHATLMTHRDTFFGAGGLSTHLMIANDTQFLLRAYFKTTIRNVDEFLYIRRRHAAS